jgi:hypothetical protein
MNLFMSALLKKEGCSETILDRQKAVKKKAKSLGKVAQGRIEDIVSRRCDREGDRTDFRLG